MSNNQMCAVVQIQKMNLTKEGKRKAESAEMCSFREVPGYKNEDHKRKENVREELGKIRIDTIITNV